MNKFDETIHTDRLLLRRLVFDDGHDMFEYSSIPNVTEHLSWNAHKHLRETESYVMRIIHEYETDEKCFTWGISIKSINKIIGIVRVFDISLSNKRLELSYIMNPEYQGKGYITEALKAVIDFCLALGINRIQARCTTTNLASEKVMKKLNMKYEGILKGYWINKGVVRDAKIYALVITPETQPKI